MGNKMNSLRRLLSALGSEIYQDITKSRMLSDENVMTIFDNIRNTSLAALVYWGGLVLALRPNGQGDKIVGLILVLVAFVLFIINVLHGVKKVLQATERRVLAAVLSLIFYVCVIALFTVMARAKVAEVRQSGASKPTASNPASSIYSPLGSGRLLR